MGEMADYAIEREIDRQLYPFGVDVVMSLPNRVAWRAKIAQSVWTTKTGEQIKFADMDLGHFRNVLRMVEARKHKHAQHLRDYYQFRVTTERRHDQ